jgi:hypothetical protein
MQAPLNWSSHILLLLLHFSDFICGDAQGCCAPLYYASINIGANDNIAIIEQEPMQAPLVIPHHVVVVVVVVAFDYLQ